MNKDSKIYVKISSDFKRAILVCGKEENYILENEEGGENFPKNTKYNDKSKYSHFTSYKTSLRKMN